MPTFRCNNERCKDYRREEFIPRVKFVWNETTKKLEADKAKCPLCKTQREVVKPEGPIVFPWFKAEDARNYDNKKIKKYDYDTEAVKSETTPLSRSSIQKEFERN